MPLESRKQRNIRILTSVQDRVKKESKKFKSLNMAYETLLLEALNARRKAALKGEK